MNHYKPPFGTGKENTWIVVILVIVPTCLLIGALTLITEFGPDPIWLRILLIPVAIFLFLGWLVLVGRIMDKSYGRKYRLKIRDGDRYVHITPLTDPDVIDDLDRNGAVLFFHDPDEGFRNYTYNLFHDSGLFEHPKDLNFYSINQETFLNHFTYYERQYYRYENIYVLPYSELGTDKEGFDALRGNTLLFVYYMDFTDLCDGITSCQDYGIWYRYKEARKSGKLMS